MPLDAPTPRTVRRGRTEDREEVAFGIAHEAIGSWRLRGFEGSEHALEVHDLRRRHIAALAEAGLQQVERERVLRWAHLLDRQAAPRQGLGRNEMPVDRKSTRLNSSHSQISYAVFCLKKTT